MFAGVRVANRIIGIGSERKMRKNRISYDRLHELLNYNPETGIFTWKIDRGNFKAGKQAGTLHHLGYINIIIDWKSYGAHRLAWLYINGYFPENQIDHINRDKTDNRIKNLREATCQCNNRNRDIQKNNKTGIVGVHWSKTSRKYRAEIKINRKTIHLGYFKILKEATQARWEAEKKYNFPDCNTTSSAYQYLKKNK